MKIGKYLKYIILGLLIVVVVLVIALQFHSVQTAVVKKIANYLSQKTNTHIEVGAVKINLFTTVKLEDIDVMSPMGDTMIHLGEVYLRGSRMLHDDRVIEDIEVSGLSANITKDSVLGNYNIQGFIDFFASNDTVTKSKKPLPDINLRHINIEDVTLQYDDLWEGVQMHAAWSGFEVKPKKLALKENKYDIEFVKLDKPMVYWNQFAKSKNWKPSPPNTKKDTVSSTSSPSIYALLSQLTIADGSFYYGFSDEVHKSKGLFDERHIDLSHINLDLDSLVMDNGNITTMLHQLTAKDQSGLELKDMHTKLQLNSSVASFSHLTMITNESNVFGDLHFDYGDPSNLSDFIEKVFITASLQNSTISTNDISYFSDALHKWDFSGIATLDFRGTISDFSTNIHDLRTPNAHFIGTVKMKGLTDMQYTQIDVDAKSLTGNYTALATLAPQLDKVDAVDFRQLSPFDFKGNFSGKYLDFVVKGNLITPKGVIEAKNFHMNMFPKVPTYGGDMILHSINLYKVIPDLAPIALDGHVKFEARDFDYSLMQLEASGYLNKATYDGRSFTDINFESELKNKNIKNHIITRTDQINGDFEFDYLQGQRTGIVVNGKFERIDLQKLGFVTNKLIFEGVVDANLNSDFSKNILGTAYITDAHIISDTLDFYEKSIQLTAKALDSTIAYDLVTSSIVASLKGNFAFDDLNGMVMNNLHHYLPAYVSHKDWKYNPKAFAEFSVKGDELDKYIHLFNSEISIPYFVNFGMSLKNNSVLVDGTIPELRYGNYLTQNIVIDVDGDNQSAHSLLTIDRLISDKDTLFHNIELTNSFADNLVHLELLTDDPYHNTNALKGLIMANDDTLTFKVENSDIFIDNKKWQISSQRNSIYSEKYLWIEETNITHDNESFTLKSEKVDGSPYPAISLIVNSFELKNVLNLLDLDIPEISSTIKGKITVKEPLNNLNAETDITFNDFKLKDQNVGQILVKARYNSANKKLEIVNSAIQPNASSDIVVNGYLMNDSTKELHLDFVSKDFDIHPYEVFTEDYIENLQGILNGNISIRGTASDPLVTGDCHLRSAGFTVFMIGTRYQIPDLHLNVYDDRFECDDNTVVLDEKGNKAYLSGLIGHGRFQYFNFFLQFKSDKFYCLNTTSVNNSQFYGNATGAIDVNLVGLLEDLNFTIDITPNEPSAIYIVNQEDEGKSTYDFMSFRGIKDMKDTTKVIAKKENKMKLQLDASLNSFLTTNIIIDPIENSYVKGVASGNIALIMPIGYSGPEAQMKMNGDVNIIKGEMVYFNSDNLSATQIAGEKKFVIEPNTNIHFDGDPMDFTVNGQATMMAHVRNLEGMFSNRKLDEMRTSNPNVFSDIDQPQDVQVTLSLDNGTLNDLNRLDYRITLKNEETSRNYEIKNQLDAINANPQEAQKQVLALLLLNSFLSPDNVDTRNLLASALSSSVNLLTGKISESLDRAVKNITNMENLDVGVNMRFDGDYANANATNANVISGTGLTPVLNVNGRLRLVNDRLVLKVGYDMNLASGSSAYYAVPQDGVTGDYRLEYRLKTDGNVKVYIYRNASYNLIVSDTKISKAGIGISASKQYDHLNELFRKKISAKKRQEMDTVQALNTIQRFSFF